MYRGFIEKNGEVSYMKVKEKLKAYIVRLIREESEELVKRQDFLEKNVRDLNAQMEGQEALAENVRNLNAQMESQEALAENVRNLNAQMESQEALAENVRNLNAQMEVVTENVRNLNAQMEVVTENVQNLNAQIEVQEAITENVRNLNAQMEVQEAIAENVRNLNVQMESYNRLEKNVQNLNLAMEEQRMLNKDVQNLNIVVSEYNKLVENVRNLNAQMEGYKVLEENVQNLNAILKEYSRLTENVRNINLAIEEQQILLQNLNVQMESQEALIENVQNLNAAIKLQDTLTENVQNLNYMLQDYKKVVENQRNNTLMIEAIRSSLEMQKVKLIMLEKTRSEQNNCQIFSENEIKAEKPKAFVQEESTYNGIDYFDFENYFRGSMDQIKRDQQQYIKYYESKNNVVDLGCGRGEFLMLLNENGISAKGVDLYEEFVEMCTMNGLDAVCDDALHFLNQQQKVGGIFAAQLIEHLTTNQLVELCKLAYEKLEEGAYLIMETPNPTCLSIFSHAFYVDPSHNKPIHPLTIKYILEKSGFTDIDIIYTTTSRHTSFIPALKGIEDVSEFNNAMHTISEMLFGSQDYAAIARKCGDR